MKIFEIREDQAWGPNDRGHVIGYIKALSKKDAMEKLNITHGFIQLFEISLTEYKEMVEIAKRNLKMLDLNQSLVHIK